MSKLLALVAGGLAALLVCSPERDSTPYRQLVDCTEKHFDQFADVYEAEAAFPDRHAGPDWTRTRAPAELDAGDRSGALAIASSWARRHCYLPCSFEMCGALVEGPPGSVVVYMHPTELGFVSPEAEVLISLEKGAVQEHWMYHTGCALRRQECVPPGS